METKKIAIGCFVGGVIGTVVALLCAPMFWWLGMLTGFGVGYLCYDLKEVKEKIPVAWSATKKEGGLVLEWLVKPHPFLWPVLVFSILFGVLLCPFLSAAVGKDEGVPFVFKVFLIYGLVPLTCGLYFFLVLAALVKTGVHKRRVIWEPSLIFWTEDEKDKLLLKENYKAIPLTYRNIYGLVLTGLGCFLLSVIETTPKVLKGIIIGAWVVFWFIFYKMWMVMAKFLVFLFKLIHSRKRVLCGIDSAIGVVAAYILIGTNAVTSPEKTLAIVCGGIIGATIGVIHYKLAKIVHLIPNVNGI